MDIAKSTRFRAGAGLGTLVTLVPAAAQWSCVLPGWDWGVASGRWWLSCGTSGMYALGVATVCACVVLPHCDGFSKYDHDIVYDFEESLEGWGVGSASEQQIDVAARGGHLVGTLGGGAFVSEPYIDSPPLAVSAAGRQTVAIRARRQGCFL